MPSHIISYKSAIQIQLKVFLSVNSTNGGGVVYLIPFISKPHAILTQYQKHKHNYKGQFFNSKYQLQKHSEQSVNDHDTSNGPLPGKFVSSYQTMNL